MVKKLLLIILLGSFLQAGSPEETVFGEDYNEEAVVSQVDLLDSKISSFMDQKKYAESKNLISYLFSSRGSYYRNGEVDSILVLGTLKDNGLLNLFSKEPQEIELVFYTNFNSLASIKAIVESLNSMGYSFFLTKKISKSLEGLQWHIIVSTQHIPNPILLNENLAARGCEVEEVTKEANIWSYKINTQNVVIDSIDVQANIATQLRKPLIPYWIRVYGLKDVTIRSSQIDQWYPKVSFYDNNLMLLEKVEFDQRKLVIKIEIPQKAFYIKIEDKYTLDNIKRGLNVLFK